jgi:hypothetical protein
MGCGSRLVEINYANLNGQTGVSPEKTLSDFNRQSPVSSAEIQYPWTVAVKIPPQATFDVPAQAANVIIGRLLIAGIVVTPVKIGQDFWFGHQ